MTNICAGRVLNVRYYCKKQNIIRIISRLIELYSEFRVLNV